MFTGSAPYADIFRRMFDPALVARVAWSFPGALLGLGRVRGISAAAMQERETRITSYNVCYTKLLRMEPDWVELAEWVERLRELPIDDIDQELVAAAFTAAHSSAEVYRVA